MKRYVITTGTVTQAIKGRDVLRKKGFKVSVSKSSEVIPNSGCGYSIVLEGGNITDGEKLLRRAGIRIQSITEK